MGKDLTGKKELGEGIYQRKDGRYCGRFTDRFGKRKTTYGDTVREVKDALVKLRYENDMKLNVISEDVTLDEWYVKWMEVHKFNVIRNSSKLVYDGLFRKYISPALGKFCLNEITQLQIKDLINSVKKKSLGFETQNKISILLLDLFGKAMIDDFVRKNPCRGIKLVRDEDEDGGKDIKVLTMEEQALFFDCCNGTFYDNLFTVAVNTGLRMGELTALTADDIDWDKMVIRVIKTLLYQKLDGDTKKTFHIHPPKTKTSHREVPINPDCALALKRQIVQKSVVEEKSAKKPLPGFENLLFTTKFNTPICCQIYNDAIKAIVTEINLTRDTLEELECFGSHCFRHTFATRAIESGTQPRTVQDYLGHATLEMTTSLYVTVLDNHKKTEKEKLSAKMDEVKNLGDKTTIDRYNKLMKSKSKVVEFRSLAQ